MSKRIVATLVVGMLTTAGVSATLPAYAADLRASATGRSRAVWPLWLSSRKLRLP